MNDEDSVSEPVSVESDADLSPWSSWTLWEQLKPAIFRLDALLDRALRVALSVLGEPSLDSFRGLSIGPDTIERLQGRQAGSTWSIADEAVDELGHGARLEAFAESQGLDRFDLDILLIALAPEIDLKYERFFAYLQDDIARKRPTVDLALNLLCFTPESKFQNRHRFDPDAQLVRKGLLTLQAEPGQVSPPFLGLTLKLDEQIVDALCGQTGLDRRLNTFVDFVHVEPQEIFQDKTNLPLSNLFQRAWRANDPLILYFEGRPDLGQRQLAEALAGFVGANLLVASLSRLAHDDSNLAKRFQVLVREAQFQRAILVFEGLEESLSPDLKRQVEAILCVAPGIKIVMGSIPWPFHFRGFGVLLVPFTRLASSELRALWSQTLSRLGESVDDKTLDDLAERFQLGPDRIAEASEAARLQARLRDATDGRIAISREDLFASARHSSGQELGALARKIEPKASWNDLILPDDSLLQLQELCQRAGSRRRVMESWGFGKKLSRGKGVSALFAGPSGTGKTMAAEVLANALGLDLCAIDLAGVVSKYIGETEKNLDRIFRAATDASAVLFFDEADALFGKRSEVRDAHDRYANIEISYLLQKIEQYEGVAILATNLRHNMDDAFTRRLAFCVSFPFPDETNRRRIWERVWPAETPLAADLDLDLMANRFKLSGGNIKNLALAAAFLAAGEGNLVRMSHLIQATRREFQKMGKTLSDEEIFGSPLEGQHA